ncbi:MAG: glycosyltransferase family A protein [Burkholderiales bacterium]|nr:glycosyltransferase family A protein [Burkholderiales bacterium]
MAVTGTFDLSVIVSTYNRSADLRRMLDALARNRTGPDLRWEVLVADNASSDNTAAVLQDFAATAPMAVMALYEPRRGKANGLNQALGLARGDVVAFIDDDILVADDWVATVVAHFHTHPAAQCIGGRVELHDPLDAPVTIKRSLQASRTKLAGFSPDNIPIIGCNMAFRADWLRSLGRFDTNIGPGSAIGVAEDLDMLYRVVRAGGLIEYVPGLLVQHNHGRRTPEQLRGLYAGYYAGRGAFYAKYILRRDALVMRWAYWEARKLLRPHTEPMRQGLYRRSRLHSLLQLGRGALRYLRLAQDKSQA